MPDRYSLTNAGVTQDFGADGSLEITGMQLSLTDTGAQSCDADTVLDSGETGVLTITLRNRGFQRTAGTEQLTLSADQPSLSFLDGATAAVPALDGGRSTTVTARVQLAGLALPGAARVTANVDVGPDSRTLDLPLHRDDIAQRSTTDDAEADTARMNRELQAVIDTMPEQYYWVHKRFKTRPDGEPSVYG